MGCFTVVISSHRARETRTKNPNGVCTSNKTSGSVMPGFYAASHHAGQTPEREVLSAQRIGAERPA